MKHEALYVVAASVIPLLFIAAAVEGRVLRFLSAKRKKLRKGVGRVRKRDNSRGSP